MTTGNDPTLAPPASIPPGTPERLTTGDVAAVLGFTLNQVRHARRRRNGLKAAQNYFHQHHTYAPEDVQAYAERNLITPNWSALEIVTTSTSSTT